MQFLFVLNKKYKTFQLDLLIFEPVKALQNFIFNSKIVKKKKEKRLKMGHNAILEGKYETRIVFNIWQLIQMFLLSCTVSQFLKYYFQPKRIVNLKLRSVY